MALTLRRKTVVLCAMLYWPALFVLTHVPMPQSIQAAHVADKGLHFVAYFLLVLLIWACVCPYERVRWNRATVWWVLLLLLCYGAVDEWSQGWVRGRSADIGDFYADMAATMTGLLLLSFLSFWAAWLWGGALAIFAVSVVAKGDLTSTLPLATMLVHVISFSLFTLLWILYLSQPSGKTRDAGLPLWQRVGAHPRGRLPWVGRACAIPLGLLVAVKLGAIVAGRAFPSAEMGAAVLVIGICVGGVLALAIARDGASVAVNQP